MSDNINFSLWKVPLQELLIFKMTEDALLLQWNLCLNQQNLFEAQINVHVPCLMFQVLPMLLAVVFQE